MYRTFHGNGGGGGGHGPGMRMITSQWGRRLAWFCLFSIHCALFILPHVISARDTYQAAFFLKSSTEDDIRFIASGNMSLPLSPSIETKSIGKTPVSLEHDILPHFMVPRISGTPGNRAVQEYIIETFKSLNWDVQEDPFEEQTPLGMKSFNNIIVTKNPNASERLVLAAHFDSKYFPDFEFIGATDSAVPCAILVDLAINLNELFNSLHERMASLDHTQTIQIIFFDGEEAFVDWTATDSLYGSRHLAKKWENTLVMQGGKPSLSTKLGEKSKAKNILSQIKCFILLDLLGDPTSTIINMNHETSWMFDRLVSIQKYLHQLNVLSPSISTRMKKDGFAIFHSVKHRAGVEDDHKPFQDRGVPVVHLIPVPFPSVWHTRADDLEHISLEAVQDIALILKVMICEYFGLLL